MLELSRFQLRVGLTGGKTVPQLPKEEAGATTTSSRDQKIEALWSQSRYQTQPFHFHPCLRWQKKKKKIRCKFSAMLAARSVIQQQMDLMVLPGARPADEIPSKAEAGHSPPKMSRGIKER